MSSTANFGLGDRARVEGSSALEQADATDGDHEINEKEKLFELAKNSPLSGHLLSSLLLVSQTKIYFIKNTFLCPPSENRIPAH